MLGRHDPPLSVECRWEDRRATVVVRGEVDFATAGILARQLDEVAGQQPEHLTVDLGLTSFLDAAACGSSPGPAAMLTPRCPLTLRSPTRQVRLVLEVSGLAGECPIEEPGHAPLSQPAGRQVQVSRIAVLSRFSAPARQC